MNELLLGISLGFGAGIAPGPLLALVMTTTLQRGLLAGIRVALSPLVTDAPIILLCVLVLSSLPPSFHGIISLIGGLFVIYLGVDGLREAQHATLEIKPTPDSGARDLLRGAMVNALSPHPWIFWLGVGAVKVVDAWKKSPGNAFAFLFGFFLLLIGCKVLIASGLAFGRRWLTLPLYRGLLTVGGLALLVAGGFLLLGAVQEFTRI
jgi:threonine/homoserine/homoserine lactone efflux protein